MEILYRRAVPADCRTLAELKGMVWNTTYRGFFEIAREQVRSAGYREFFVSVNRQNHSAIRFYLAMGGRIVHEDDRQLKIGYTV